LLLFETNAFCILRLAFFADLVTRLSAAMSAGVPR
jgi:hypothetical protein